MNPPDPACTITTLEALLALYDQPGKSSTKKEIPYLHPHYRALIEASPFAILATSGPSGLDASPRGDPPGFVLMEDETTLLMPERRGNNRVDSLRNIVVDPRVALLFLIPGLGETLRVNGRATISVDPALMQRFAMDGKPPKCVLVIHVETVYFQCARAILRSRLWDPPAPGIAATIPTPGKILEAITEALIDGDKYDRELPERQRDTLY